MSGWTTSTVFLGLLPLAFGATQARWGHTSVYVPAQQAVYAIGGEVQSSGPMVTNDVLVMNLNATGATFSAGPNSGLPAHAFAAASLSQDGESIVVLGGIAGSCADDATTHTFSLTEQTWQSANPTSFVRRRGSSAAWVDDGTPGGEIVVVGGVADTYSCSTGSYTYPATDVLSFPLSTAAPTTKSLPSGLTGSNLAVSDYAFTRGTDGSLYLIGGQDMNGNVVPLTTVGRWNSGKGWYAETTTGNVPPGRVGASLVAHPTLDLLILHGGNVNDSPSSSLAFLNTTTWTWSTPSNLQPPASSAVAYHTSVITSHGVMITAFGLSSGGSPSSQVHYLDMRDPSQQAWAWKSSWTSDMLQAYTPAAGSSNAQAGSTVANTANTGAVKSESEQHGSVSGEKKKVTSIVIPVIIAALIILPLSIWFLRRKLRMDKKRRMARHFSFSSQEDEGDFQRSVSSLRSPARKTKTQYGFGRDANEKDGNVFTDLAGAVKRWTNSRRSISSDGTIGEREMMQADRRQVSRLDERTMRWEEIDFGLGKLDERAQGRSDARRASMPAMGVATTDVDPFSDPAPLIQLHDNTDDWSQNGMAHGDSHPVPELLVQPPTVQTSPAATLPDPTYNPTSQDGLDWSILAQEMEARPAFRSISPTSVLRSHAHPAPAPISTAAVSPFEDFPTALPYRQEDGYPPAPATPRSPVSATPIEHAQSSGPPRLPSLDFSRPSTDLLPRPSSVAEPGSRRASQPIQGRQLAGATARRGSIAFSSASSPTAPDYTARRASNPTSSAVYTTPWSPGSDSVRARGSPQVERRGSGMSKLRVVNMTDDDEADI